MFHHVLFLSVIRARWKMEEKECRVKELEGRIRDMR